MHIFTISSEYCCLFLLTNTNTWSNVKYVNVSVLWLWCPLIMLITGGLNHLPYLMSTSVFLAVIKDFFDILYDGSWS